MHVVQAAALVIRMGAPAEHQWLLPWAARSPPDLNCPPPSASRATVCSSALGRPAPPRTCPNPSRWPGWLRATSAPPRASPRRPPVVCRCETAGRARGLAAAAAACRLPPPPLLRAITRSATHPHPQPPRKDHLPAKITPHITGLRTDEELAAFVERTRGSTVRHACVGRVGGAGARPSLPGCRPSPVACRWYLAVPIGCQPCRPASFPVLAARLPPAGAGQLWVQLVPPLPRPLPRLPGPHQAAAGPQVRGGAGAGGAWAGRLAGLCTAGWRRGCAW